MVGSVVGRDDEGDLPSRAVDQHELVEVVVHTAPVVNRLITELADIVDAIGCSHAVERLLLQIFLQLAGYTQSGSNHSRGICTAFSWLMCS